MAFLLRVGLILVGVRFVTSVLFRLVFRRFAGCLVWVLVLGLVVVAALAIVHHAHAQGSTPRGIRLASPVPAHRELVTHGTFLAVSRQVWIPVRAHLILAASPNGQAPPVVDDLLILRLTWPGHRPITVAQDFDRSDGRGVEPARPLILPAIPARTHITVQLQLIDTRPPQFFSSALWLVALPTTPSGTEAGSRPRKASHSSGGFPLPSPSVTLGVAAGAIVVAVTLMLYRLGLAERIVTGRI